MYGIFVSDAHLRLVVLRGGLAGLELLKVPVADLHVAVVLVQALGEGLGGALAVVGTTPLVVLLGRGLDLLLRSGSRLGGAAGEEAADSMADGGAYSNTTTAKRTVSQYSGLKGRSESLP